ncbi:hypothetical protein BDW68DRAFT_101270 [Aspergillus falconensis]
MPSTAQATILILAFSPVGSIKPYPLSAGLTSRTGAAGRPQSRNDLAPALGLSISHMPNRLTTPDGLALACFISRKQLL